MLEQISNLWLVFRADLRYKLASLLAAVLLWLYIDGQLIGDHKFELALEEKDLVIPAGIRLASGAKLPHFVVVVRGAKSRLPGLRREHFVFEHPPIENIRPGRNSVTLSAADLRASGFEIVSVSPKNRESGHIDFVAIDGGETTVRARMIGAPREGYVAREPIVIPSGVKLADSIQADWVWTRAVDISNATATIISEVSIESAEKSGAISAVTCPDKFRVEIRIVQPDNFHAMMSPWFI